MTRNEIISKLEQVGIDITDADMRWMEKVHEKSIDGPVSLGELLVELHDQFSEDYKPSQIDSALYRANEDNSNPSHLTLLACS